MFTLFGFFSWIVSGNKETNKRGSGSIFSLFNITLGQYIYIFFQIHLCSGDQILGKAVVSFQGLLSERETLAMPAVIEGMFPLVAPGSGHQHLGPPQDTEPGVGVSVSLRCEQPDIARNVPSGSSPAGGRDMRGQVILKSKPQLHESCVPDVICNISNISEAVQKSLFYGPPSVYQD